MSLYDNIPDDFVTGCIPLMISASERINTFCQSDRFRTMMKRRISRINVDGYDINKLINVCLISERNRHKNINDIIDGKCLYYW